MDATTKSWIRDTVTDAIGIAALVVMTMIHVDQKAVLGGHEAAIFILSIVAAKLSSAAIAKRVLGIVSQREPAIAAVVAEVEGAAKGAASPPPSPPTLPGSGVLVLVLGVAHLLSLFVKGAKGA